MLAATLTNELDLVNKIAIDIGGTNTRIAGLKKDNEIVDLEVFQTNPNNFMDTYKKIQNFIAKFNQIDLIGFCIPGTIDYDKGVIIYCNNLPSWKNLPIVSIFKIDYPNAEIRISNDARAAALGQYEKFKTNPKAEVLFFTTISTGIGSGLVNHGKILKGINYNAGEVAFVMPDNLEVDSSIVKGIEYYASGTGIMKNYPYNNSKTIEQLFSSTVAEDQMYLDSVENRLASYFATAIGFYNPGMIVVGGSVAEKNHDFMNRVFAKTKQLIIPEVRNTVEFKIADDATSTTLIGLVS